LLIVDCWLLTVGGRVEKLNGWVLTVDSILLLWCTRKRYKEISSFEEVVPTAENIAVRIGQLLLAPVWDLGSELHKIKLIESPNNSCEIYGADLEEVAAQRQQPEAVLAGVRSQKSGRLGRVHPDIWLIVQIGEPRPTSLIMIPRVIQPH
jgi:6-pyruvoyl-tetrahydropterin synthase